MPSDRLIEFRGMRVAEEWPAHLEASQLEEFVYPNGLEMTRVRYGDESDDTIDSARPCHDCAAILGEFHAVGCDMERCPNCGGQLFVCDCDWPEDPGDDET